MCFKEKQRMADYEALSTGFICSSLLLLERAPVVRTVAPHNLSVLKDMITDQQRYRAKVFNARKTKQARLPIRWYRTWPFLSQMAMRC